jgi:small subunit ribosomal protein S7
LNKYKAEIKLFEKWSFDGIEVNDPGLKRYICLDPILIPTSGGRHEHRRFKKSEVNIAERLVNTLMRPGRAGGKKARAINFVKNAFEIINLRSGKNPLEILVKAVENAAPSEETTRISYGGVVYHISVDIAAQRRVDLALRFISNGAREASLNNPKTIEECLADELLYAAARDPKSYSVQKRDETERVALASR